ncbi:MAG: hypothetical protein AAGI11_01385 [Pseudomonadota bacterium]
MEKVIYPIWRPEGTSSDRFREQLLGPFSEAALARDDVHALTICVVDDAVAPASVYRMENIFERGYDGVIMLWVARASALEGEHLGLADYCERYCGYLVSEANPLPEYREFVSVGQRTAGMNQVVCLQRPASLEMEEWRSIWQDLHTPVAIDTQSTFGYRQNLVVRALQPDAPPLAAIIEENFPEAAIHSRLAFYDAGEDEALYQAREKAMVDSCVRFIDFERIDCIPTSEYPLKVL